MLSKTDAIIWGYRNGLCVVQAKPKELSEDQDLLYCTHDTSHKFYLNNYTNFVLQNHSPTESNCSLYAYKLYLVYTLL